MNPVKATDVHRQSIYRQEAHHASFALIPASGKLKIMPATSAIDMTSDLTDALRGLALAEPGETPRYSPLAGGVSSDIWRVDLRRGPVCMKRALPKLRVARDWFAPVERWQYEYAWFAAVARIAPHAVPQLLGKDPKRQLFVMEFLDPGSHLLWKAELHHGVADPKFSASVGRLLAMIHAATAGRPDIADQFPTDAIFGAIRLEPYLAETARAHPDLASQLNRLVEVTAANKRALVHGDISPKNILVGPQGPVFLDAECAWYGDPAFDLAFCLNHLMLKCLWVPEAAPGFLSCFDALSEAYLAGANWEPRREFEMRAAALLPGLFLARIDGKSPVEYVVDEDDKNRVRRVGRALIAAPMEKLRSIRDVWARELKIV